MKGKENKHTKFFAKEKQKQDENILGYLEGYIGKMMGKGKDEQHNGQLILTDQRVVFMRKGLVSEVFQTIPIDKVTSVESFSRLGYKNLKIYTSSDDLEFKTLEVKELVNELVDKLEEIRNKAPKPAQAAPSSPSDSIPDQIKKLAELRDSGILTDEEFDSKKTQLLAAM